MIVALQLLILHFTTVFSYANISFLCPGENYAHIDTVETFPRLNFTPHVSPSTVSLWNNALENRYQLLAANKNRPELKVFVVPHSHNDPGWLETFETYYETKTKFILDNIVAKLTELSNMTFVWNEISFLEKWWRLAEPAQKEALKKLIKQGRLEITTGGWVMPDEACTHIYSLLDQYIEGHEWLRINLGVAPTTGWSIDPFGHGPTVPYILDQSGFEGTIIQRVHYAWKQWLAEAKSEDFYWITAWIKNRPALLVHNMPMEIYSVKGSCGPHPLICEEYNFKTSDKFLNDLNLDSKANTLMEEYQRLGSLTEHNVVLIQLGEDFSYQNASEFDYKYKNYQLLFNYINERKQLYKAHVQFGTPKDYFKEIKKNNAISFPFLKGDFFPYSDMFTTGEAQYWTGFYTTNPYMKIIARQLEHQLRTSEILFSLVYNRINCDNKTYNMEMSKLKFYKYLVSARRNLGLFQHHDGITGTSKAHVMKDYGKKLFKSLRQCGELQDEVLAMEMMKDSQKGLQSRTFYSDNGRTFVGALDNLKFTRGVVVFNSLSEEREVVFSILVHQPNIVVYDTFRKRLVKHQINPKIEFYNKKPVISSRNFIVVFVAELPALTAITYTIQRANNNNTAQAIIYSDNNFVNKENISFKVMPLPPDNIVLQNSIYNLTFDRKTGFIKEVYRKDKGVQHNLSIEIGAYNSYSMESGAYLFKPHPKKPVKQNYLNNPDAVIVTVGSITSEINSFYLPHLEHKVEITHSSNFALSRGISIKNSVYFNRKVADTEMFMRFHTDIKSGNTFYTDQNGFQYQKRVSVKKLGIEGNYYPISTMAWIQDKKTRLTYVTNHAQGASSFKSGRLEVMLHRTPKYDDGRGLGEGISVNEIVQMSSYLVFDSNDTEDVNENFHQLPSTVAAKLSRDINYPVNVYISTKRMSNLNSYVTFGTFPSDLHLMSLRTITENDLPSQSFYMVLHRPGYSCQTGVYNRNPSSEFNFTNLQISNITAVSLTGLEVVEVYSNLSKLEYIYLNMMDIKTYRIDLASNLSCTK